MKRKWGTVWLCTAAATSLVLSGCGSAQAEQSSEPEVSSGQQEEVSPAGGTVFYEGNDVVMTLTETEDAGMFYFVRLTVENTGENNVNMRLYPLLLNNDLTVSDGLFESIDPGAEEEFEIGIRTDVLTAAGVYDIGTLEGYLVFEDENYDEIGEPELVTVYEADGSAEAVIPPSENVLFDDKDVYLTYQGSYHNTFDENVALFLVQNRSDVMLNVSDDMDSIKIDGKPQDERILLFHGATVLPGKDALVYMYVLDGTTFEGAAFETLDFKLYVSSDIMDPQYIPVSMIFAEDRVRLVEEETPSVPAKEEKPQEGSAEEEMLTLPEALDVLTDAMIWRYEYGEDTYDSEYLMFMSDTEVELNTVSRGPFEVTDNGDGTFTIDALLSSRFQGKETTRELQFILSRTDGQYMITPAGDYWMKSIEPDNPVWDNVVFLPDGI